MSDWKAKRFWKSVEVLPVEGGFAIALDGRRVKTPAKAALVLPTRAMAEAVASEWDAQEGLIDPMSMPCSRTANAAIDKVAPQHGAVADMLAAYGDSDLLCYRADAPEGLVARQAAGWDPMLDWAAEVLEAKLTPVTGVIHKPQSPQALSQLAASVHAMTDFELAAFHDLVSLSGSLVLGFAAALDARDPDEIWALSRIDETWQAEQWGFDAEAEAMAETKRAAFLHAHEMYHLAR